MNDRDLEAAARDLRTRRRLAHEAAAGGVVCAVLAATASLVSVASTERSNASREVTRMSPAART